MTKAARERKTRRAIEAARKAYDRKIKKLGLGFRPLNTLAFNRAVREAIKVFYA